MRLSSERMVLLGMGVAMFATLGASFETFRSTSATDDAASRVSHTLEVRSRLEEALALSRYVESGAFGYVISGDTSPLIQYDSARGALTSVLNRVRELTADNSNQQRRADTLAGLAPVLVDQFARLIDVRRRQGAQAAAQEVRMDGSRLMRRVRGLILEMEEEEARLLGARTVTLQAQRRAERLAVGTAAAIGLLAIALSTVLILRTLHARRRDEETFQVVVESAPSAMLIVDADGIIVLVNGEAERLFGYGRKTLVGQSVDILVPQHAPGHDPEHRVGFFADPQSLATNATHDLVARRRDGAEVRVEIGLTPLEIGGRPFVLASVVDISDRKKDEEALRTSLGEVSDLYNNAPVGYHLLDEAGLFIRVNDTELSWLGYTREELIGRRKFEDLLAPSSRREFRLALRKHKLEGPIRDLDVALVRRDASTLSAILNSSIVLDADGKLAGTRWTVFDNSERRAAEQQLRSSEARLRALMDSAHDGIAVLSDDGVVLETNRRMAEINGRSQERIVGHHIAEFADAESFVVKEPEFRAAVANRAGDITGVRIRRPDDSVATVDFSISAANVGGVWMLLSLARDVTEQHLLEDQFRQAQRMESVGRLAGGIAHDFNNLLTVITVSGDLLMDDLGADHPNLSDIKVMLSAAGGAATLTRQLLAFTRQQVLQPVVLDVNVALTNIHKLLEPLLGEDAVLTSRIIATPARVKIDPGQLEQIIINLAVNARDAMPAGGRLTIENAIVDVDASYLQEHPQARHGRYVLLAVSDTGSGMSTKTIARIFEPFFTTKDLGKGTGLGLATVFGIVKQSDGFIWVESELGVGSTFKVYLPSVDESEALGVLSLPVSRPVRGTETILLVEDVTAVRVTTRRLLERYGYAVLEAHDGTSAIECARSFEAPIHLLLTDVIMPGMSGRELADRLVVARTGMRVLYASGYTDGAIVHHGVLEEGIAFIAKPFTADALALKVRDVLDAPEATLAIAPA